MKPMRSQCDLLAQAIDAEKEWAQFYSEAAAKASDEKARDTLLELGNEEHQHGQVLEEQLRSIEESGVCSVSVARLTDEEPGHPPRAPFIPTDRKRAMAMAQAGKDELEALAVGMKAEEAASHFYTQAAQREEVPELKALYESLAARESEHFQALQQMHDFLADPEAWYTRQERPMFEG